MFICRWRADSWQPVSHVDVPFVTATTRPGNPVERLYLFTPCSEDNSGAAQLLCDMNVFEGKLLMRFPQSEVYTVCSAAGLLTSVKSRAAIVSGKSIKNSSEKGCSGDMHNRDDEHRSMVELMEGCVYGITHYCVSAVQRRDSYTMTATRAMAFSIYLHMSQWILTRSVIFRGDCCSIGMY